LIFGFDQGISIRIVWKQIPRALSQLLNKKETIPTITCFGVQTCWQLRLSFNDFAIFHLLVSLLKVFLCSKQASCGCGLMMSLFSLAHVMLARCCHF